MRLQVQLQEAQTGSEREEGWEGPNQSPAYSGRTHTLIGQRGSWGHALLAGIG